jgi:UPF0716 protein FxsA
VVTCVGMPFLFLAFVLIPFAELYLLIQIGEVIGAWYTLLMVLVVGFVGAALAKREGLRVLRAWRDAMQQGRLPEEGVLGGLLVFAGGLFLVTPGVLTDVIGLVLLLPYTRKVAAKLLRGYLEQKLAQGTIRVHSYGFPGAPPRGPARGTTVGSRRVTGDVINTEGEEVH